MMAAAGRRRAGLLLPLFSCASTRSWGIGDIGDLPPLAAWLAGAGQAVLQLLPLNEMAAGQHSPYSAMSAMAIDPIYIAVGDVPEFAALGGEAALGPSKAAQLSAVRGADRIDYPAVRQLKQAALRAAFARFEEAEWRRDTLRAQELKAFLAGQAWWVEDYALFRALHAREGERPWTEWPDVLRRREPEAIQRARRDLAADILFYQYLQWIAGEQWRRAREAASVHDVALFGDLPFMVDGDSADVWARQHQFILDASLGVPPDAFSETGQDWGMPVYRWEAIAADDFGWLRGRARRSADLFDGYRIDHLVGFYRTFGRPRDGRAPFFTPDTEAEQTALGERVLAILREPGSEIIAEDLGTVPDFVRASLARLPVPGFKVFRWERRWHDPGQPFVDPAQYAAASVAASGTHDTEPLGIWWAHATEEERAGVNALPTVRRIAGDQGLPIDRPEAARDGLLETLFAAGSNLLLVPIGDVFGWTERINEPGTVTDRNWSFRLPWPVDRLTAIPEVAERQEALRRWAGRHGRLSPRPELPVARARRAAS